MGQMAIPLEPRTRRREHDFRTIFSTRGAGDSNREWTAAVVKLAVLYGVRKSLAIFELFASTLLSRELFAPTLRKSENYQYSHIQWILFSDATRRALRFAQKPWTSGIMSIFSGCFFRWKMAIFADDSDENTRVQIAARCDADGSSQPLTDLAQGCRNLIRRLLFRFNKSGLNEVLGKFNLNSYPPDHGLIK